MTPLIAALAELAPPYDEAAALDAYERCRAVRLVVAEALGRLSPACRAAASHRRHLNGHWGRVLIAYGTAVNA